MERSSTGESVTARIEETLYPPSTSLLPRPCLSEQGKPRPSVVFLSEQGEEKEISEP